MKEKLKRYYNLLDAIEAERLHEEKWYRKLAQSKTKKEKQEAGILLTKLVAKSILSSVGNKPEVIFTLSERGVKHRFRVGAGCLLHVDSTHEHSIRGTVSYINQKQISVLFTQEDTVYDEIIIGIEYSIELLYDERPYTVMKVAIQHIVSSKDEDLKTLRDGIAKGDVFRNTREGRIAIPPHMIAHLNSSQQKAIQTALAAGKLSIIHGPPGTGKTTTLAALIQVLASSGRKVLACAASNNATNLIAKRIADKRINVLRIGNLSRIDEEINHLTIDAQVQNHPEWSNVKKIKIEAEDARKKANKYKRAFGPEQRMQRNALRAESKKLRAWARDLEKKILDDILSSAQVITSTLIGISTNLTKELKFDTVVIDEASQALEPECWNAMALAKHVVLVGDHLQLPPTVKSPIAIENKLQRTLLDVSINHIFHTSILQEQYRMNDIILGWPNAQFYANKLVSHQTVAHHKLHDNDFPLEYIDTSGCGFEEIMDEKSKSRFNPGEYLILREHFLQHMAYYDDSSIAIISPYAAQVHYILEQLSEDKDLSLYDITVNSIDGFQGQEKDIVYLSLVRNNDQCQLGFLQDYRRLNVALTRARKKLVIIADTATLSADDTYESLIDYIEAKGLYRSAWEFMA